MNFWSDVERITCALGQIDHFDLLGLTPDDLADGSNPLALTEAYHAALRRYHPDRHAIGATLDQKHALARICARVGEAYRVLASPAQRTAYLESLETGSARPRVSRGTLADSRDPRTEKARKLLASARKLREAGNTSAAVAKLDLALQFEPESEALRVERDAAAAPAPPAKEGA